MMRNDAVDDNPAKRVEAELRQRRRPIAHAVVPILVAVSVALPLVILWAIALIPLGVRAIPDRVIERSTLAPDDVKMLSDGVMHWLLPPCVVVFVVAHLVAVPWALAPVEHRKRARRVYWLSIAALTGLAVIIGTPAWIWIIRLPS